jgi:NADH-quinone oxidoreductase subunit C
MTTSEIHERLKAHFGDDVAPPSETKGDPFLLVKRERIVEVCRFLKVTPGLQFDFCEDLTALDFPQKNAIEVVYHLMSLVDRGTGQPARTVKLKVSTDRANPEVPSVNPVWRTADWFEREVYDLFGVIFTGHPDLRRVLLPDDWIGHPLRKDYQEAGGWHGISNERENPLVELKRLDDVARAALPKPPPPPPPPPAAAPPAPAAPAAPAAPKA